VLRRLCLIGVANSGLLDGPGRREAALRGAIGAVTINHFDPSKDVIVLTQTLVPGQNVLPAHDDVVVFDEVIEYGGLPPLTRFSH
jgi:hypothetical protein